MLQKKAVLFPLILLFLLFAGICLVFAQSRMSAAPADLLDMGIGLYGDSRFTESVTVLRLIPPGNEYYSEALYWVCLGEVASGQYTQALRDLDLLEYTRSRWDSEIPYQRGRCLFYLGRHEEALISFSRYLEDPLVGDSGRAAAWYWMGEALFAMGRLDSAADAFSQVVEKYPYSVKFEAASYRLDLITQKKIEEELLGILKWSHEESLRSLEEYQARETIYNQAISGYEKRLQEIHADGSGEPEDYRRYFAAEMRIAALEASLAEANAALEALQGSQAANGGAANGNGHDAAAYADKARRIQELRSAVLELSGSLTNALTGEQQ